MKTMFTNSERDCAMRTQLRIFAMLSFVLLLAASPALSGTNWYVSTTGSNTNPGTSVSPFATIQYAIGQASSGDVINIEAGTFSGTVNIPSGKSLQLIGAGESSTTISASSGNGINIAANSVQIDSLTVTGATDNGIYAHNVSNLTIANVHTFNNGTSANGSGIYVDGITGTSVLTNIYANNNQLHGVSISDGSNGVTISGGTFTGNGVSANTTTGGGINIHSVSSSVSNITVNGSVNSSWNMNAGIIIYAEPSSGSISTVSIGTSGTITLTGNGSGTIGEGVAIAGNVTTVNITAQFNEGSLPNGAGVAVVGTNNVGANSPSGVTISGSTFTGYGSATPAITLASSSSSPTYISTNPVTATGNTIGGSGYQTEDLIYHKLDNAALGLVTTDASNLYVTTNSGSIQRGVDAATTGQTVNVGSGTYNESDTLNKAITLAGVDTSAKINPTSGNGITVSFNGATIQNLVVFGAPGSGISATGLTGLTLTGVVSRNNTGSGAQLSNDASVTVTNGSYSWNAVQGFNATGGSSYSLSGVIANNNGNTTPQGSGINITNITGPSTVTNCTANNNHYHGLSAGDGTSGLTISGGTYTGNGTAGNATTGGGINIIAENTTTTSNITVQGSVTSSNNTTAGIYIFSDNATVNAINTVTIGASGSITLSGNGSTNGTYSGGAGVLIYGIVSAVHVANTTFTKGTAPGAGLMNLGNTTQAGSPTGTQVTGSTFVGYTSAYPAVTLTDGNGHSSPSGTNNVAATNNTFTFPVAAKVFLQGPYNGTTMNTALLTSALIPSSQPYNVAPWSYAGSEHVATIPASTVDWIFLELRSAYSGVTASKRAAFLKNDGTVIDTNGVANVTFTQMLVSGYTILDSIVVMHRNHIAVVSANSDTLPNDTKAYDFTSSQSKAHGTGQIMASLTGGLFGLWCGDTDASGVVDGGDRNNTWNNRNASTYIGSDTDLSGVTDGGDRNNTWNNRNVATQVPNYPQ